MMPLLRLIQTLIEPLGKVRLDPYATCVTRWRVLPNDVDVFGHMNNARYQSIMDLARMNFLRRCNLMRGVLRNRWSVPVGGVYMDYRTALKPFERYEVHTKLLHWDERWFYFRQDFFRLTDRSRPVATGHVKTLFVGRGGAVPTPKVVRELAGRDLVATPLSDEARQIFVLASPNAPGSAAAGDGPAAVSPAQPTPNAAEREPLAIVGIGCRLPGGIQDPESFWQFLMGGGDAIVDIPASRWDPRRYHDPTGESAGRAYVQRAGLLQQDLKSFDAAFFGISPREAETMDPQQRLLLETSWEALEDAGMAPAALAGSRTAVFTGGFMLDNFLLHTRDENRRHLGSGSATAGTMTMLASRLSYFYDLRGPSLAVDTACSSSLVACHHACESLWRGESDMALVAGVNALMVPAMQITMSKGHFLSPTGHCHAFGVDADGYTRGEGAGVLVLRPLSAAQRDGQRVYAVIRGSACNQDGRTPGITVPSGEAQQAVMREAYARAGVSPSDVAYVEAHGTGTPVGDPIEANAIGTVVGAGRAAADERCVIASVKTNLGHLEAAAGVTGLIKAALCVQRGVAPPHLHAQQVNPKIDLDALGLRLPQQATPLKARNGLLLAGVNSFGYGGTNAHVVLSNAPAAMPAPLEAPHDASQRPLLLPLSARSPESLALLAQRWGQALGADPGQAAALLRTAAVHRQHHRRRAVVLEADAAKLADAAREGRFAAEGAAEQTPELVFVYSGMGPQWWGMGQRLMATEPVFRRAMQRGDADFKRIAGWSLLEEMGRSEAHSRMGRTEIAQPANALLQIALTDLWASWGIRPAAVIGHSIGEVGAAYGAGTLDAAQALTVAYHRSRLQQRLAGRGGMLAAALTAEEAEVHMANYGQRVSVAAINGPQSLTLAGDTKALTEIAAALAAAGRFNSMLRVEVPYHSAVMDDIETDLRKALAGLRASAPRVPVYASVGGQRLEAPWHDAAYWWRNVREPVRFAAAVQAVAAAGFDTFLEIGPHPVLGQSVRDSLQAIGRKANVVSSLTRRVDDDQCIAKALAQLYTLGAEPDWAAYMGQGQAVQAPTYPWNRKRHWGEAEPAQARNPHPLITHHESGSVPSWTAEINLGRDPQWLDHVVAGAALFPAAGFIDLALSAHADIAHGAATTIEHLDLLSALVLQTSKAPELRIQQAAPEGSAFRIGASVDGEAPTLCVRGHWSSTVDREERLDSAAIAARLPQALSGTQLYERLAGMGLSYGPAYQGVQDLLHSQHEVLANLAIAPELAEGFRLPPPLLDAAMHSMLALVGDALAGCELVPTGLRELSYYRHPGHRARVWGTLDSTRAEPRADLVILDGEDRICVRLRGLSFRVLTQREEATRSLLHERRYEPCALQNQSVPAADVVYVLGASAPVGDGDRPLALPAGWKAVASEREMAKALAGEGRGGGVVDLVDLRFAHAGAGTAALTQRAAVAASDFLATVQALRPGAVRRYTLVTRQAETVGADAREPDLAATLVVGMARSAMSERPDLHMTLVDVDGALPAFEQWLGRLGDAQEWALRDGQWLAVQVLPLVLTPPAPPQCVFDAATMNCEVQIGKAGKLETLHFVQCAPVAPGPGQVAVKVHTVPLGYKDVMKALGILSSRAAADTYFGDSMGMECAGVVAAIGEGVQGLAVGDRVYAVAPGTLRAHVLTDAAMTVRLPDNVSFEQGANLVAYGTVYHGLVTLARVAPGETVLIHGATGGVGLAALQVARWRGAKVIATAGNERKRSYLRSIGVEHVSHSRDNRFYDDVMAWTDGRGVDVVLNFTPGEVLLKSLSCLARFGRFIEIGKVAFDQDMPLPLRPFTEGLSFAAIDFDRMTRFQPAEVRAIALAVLREMAAGTLGATPFERFGASQVADAFRLMARGEHLGKVVIEMTDTALQVQALPAPLLNPDATYLVTGGLGGFGRAVAKDLAARGARHLVLLSRSGPQAAGAAELLGELAHMGVNARAMAVDIADRAALAAALAEVARSMPPLRGVVHAAAVLDDRPLEALDEAALRTAFGAKADGAWHLHELTQALPLDFCVLFSSISAVLGNAHQANYAGANNFLDSLASLRRSQGRPALSVQWGVLGESGMVARDATLGRLLAQQGVQPLPDRLALDLLWQLLNLRTAAPANVIVADVDWARMARQQPAHSGESRLAHWQGSAGSDDPVQLLQQQWRREDAQAMHDAVQAELVRLAAQVMKLAASDIDPTVPLREMGLDSLMALELAGEIEAQFGVTLPTMTLAGGPPLRDVAEQLVKAIGVSDQKPAPDGTQPALSSSAALAPENM